MSSFFAFIKKYISESLTRQRNLPGLKIWIRFVIDLRVVKESGPNVQMINLKLAKIMVIAENKKRSELHKRLLLLPDRFMSLSEIISVTVEETWDINWLAPMFASPDLLGDLHKFYGTKRTHT